METTQSQVAVPVPLQRQFAKTRSFGPLSASVFAVGEAPGAQEEIKGIPFVGSSGDETDRMFAEAGFLNRDFLKMPRDIGADLLRTQRDTTIFLTNVCKYRPPENKIDFFFLDSKRTKPNELILEGIRELKAEIAQVRPRLILALGSTPLWALMGCTGITKWRGSMLHYEQDGFRCLLMPTYHPAAILREWSWRPIAIHDLRRAKEALDRGSWPERNVKYFIRPSFTDVMDCLGTLKRIADEQDHPLTIASDIETKAGYFTCHGIAWSEREAICIPAFTREQPAGYFTLDQDVAIWERERELLTHPNIEVVGQNYLYDAQYFARRRGYLPRLRHDTIAMQQTAWPGLPRGLDFLSSMYCSEHVYWKEDGKEDNPRIPQETRWAYNCTDTTRTYEVRFVLERVLRKLGLWDLYEFQISLFPHVLEMMLRGLRVDEMLREKIGIELFNAIQGRQNRLNSILGYDFNPRSTPQMHNLFYAQLRCSVIKNRKTKRPTCDEDALMIFSAKEPLLKPITDLIIDIRGLGAMNNNVIKARRDADGRMRSMFDPYKAETLRWTSSKDAWDGGTNLQNWTKGDEDKEKEAIKHAFPVPNVRKLVIPDQGFEIASIDLSGADAQAIAWESGDEGLKAAFRAGVKIHAKNAKDMWPDKCPTGFEQPYYDRCRTGVHLVNYLGGISTLAAALQCPEWEAQRFTDRWFSVHPLILEFHNRVADELNKRRYVTNAFGYRRFYFDRVDDLLPEAVAWLGQSNTACVTNRAFKKLSNSPELRQLEFQTLLQVHDELVFQYPIIYRDRVLPLVHSLAHITVPYPDPLIIPWGLKTSLKSWGECEKREWPK